MGLESGLDYSLPIHFAADGTPSHSERESAIGSQRPSAGAGHNAVDDALEPLTSRAEILGHALDTLGLQRPGLPPHWRFDQPLRFDSLPLNGGSPLGPRDDVALASSLRPAIARFLGDPVEVPVQPVTPPTVTNSWQGSMTDLVFARVRRRAAREAPQLVQPQSIARTPMEALSSGEPLQDAVRTAMEPIVGSRLNDVRIHSSPAASAMASALSADAFTVGREVFFAEGKFDPFSPRGQALLAHELTHVRQQEKPLERLPRQGEHSDPTEAEAELVERAVLDESDGYRGQLEVTSYVRRYFTASGERLSPAVRERLDSISLRAWAIAEEQLGPVLSQNAGRNVADLNVDVDVDLSSGDDVAADQWGRRLAEAIRRALT